MLQFLITLAFVAFTCANGQATPPYANEPYPSRPLKIFDASYTTNEGSGNTTNTIDMNHVSVDEPLKKLNASNQEPIAQQATTNCFIGNIIQGFDYDDNPNENNGFVYIPADPMGAAGAERLVAVVNVMIEVRTKAGVLIYRDGFRDFFASVGASQAGSAIFDPKVVYDEHAQRFVVILLQQSEPSLSRILLAVSKNERPDTINDWNRFAFDSTRIINGVNSWADYPGLEVDEEAVYVTANMFSFSSGIIQSSFLWIIEKGVNGGFYGGGTPRVVASYNLYPGGDVATTMPAQVHGSGGAGTSIGTYFVSSTVLPDGTASIQIFTIRNPLGTITFDINRVSLGRISQDNVVIPDASQPGSTTAVEVGDSRMLDAVWRNNKLWMTFTINPRTPSSDANQATAHWVRIDTTDNVLTLDAQGNLGGEAFSPQTSTSFGSVALNKQGQVAFGYAASSSTLYAGAYGSVFVGTDEYTFTVQSGLDSYVQLDGSRRNRWGDYSGISVDPIDDSFWIFNKYAITRGASGTIGQSGRWGTAWARVSCTSASSPMMTPVSVPTRNTFPPAPTAPTGDPVRQGCGFLGLSIFCPFTLCGLLGRFLGVCVDN